MKKLLELDPASPTNFTQADLAGHWDELPVGRTHNIVVGIHCVNLVEQLSGAIGFQSSDLL